MKKQQLLTLLLLLVTVSSFADIVKIGGLWYELVSKTKEAKVISSKDGNYYSGSIVIHASIEYDGDNYSVTSIGDNAFYNCSGLTSVTIPSSVTSIGLMAFDGCRKLTSIHIPNSVTSIGKNAFYKCSGLTSITIPNSVTSIGTNAFSDCIGITSINIPNSVTSIDAAFSGCSSLTSVTIPNSVTSINAAFSGCSSLTSVTIPNSVTSIGNFAFEYCSSLTAITIPNSVTSIGKYAFNKCSSLTAITIPNSVTSIGEYAFNRCSGLTSVTIPNSVTSIGQCAFYGCSGLTSVTIPNSVTSIGSGAFSNCVELTDVYCYSLIVPLIKDKNGNTCTDAFLNSYIEYATLHVPTGSIDAYKSVEPWKSFKTIIGLDGTIPEVKKCATPTISYNNGKLKFNCETEGVEYLSEVTVADAKKYYSSEVSLTATYNISVYATKQGYENSDVATTTICWKNDQESQNYLLSFVVDNKELKKLETEVGATITPPMKNSQGNTINWYTYPATMPAHDLVVYGMVPKAAAPTKYTITYVLDGQTYRSVTVDEGATVSKEKAPYKEGYTFNGWQNEPAMMPANNVTVNGTFSVNSYRLSFIVDNQELSTRNMTYGATITTPTNDNEGNTVTWYTHPTTMPAHDLVVYGMAVKEPEPEVFAWLTVNDSRSGYTKIKVKQGAEQTLNITAEEGWKISNIFMDGRYVTTRLQEDGTFVTPVITADTSIIIVYEEEAPSGVRTARSQADIKVVSDGVIISNAEPQSRCVIYSSGGQQVVNTVINDGTRKIALQQGQVYILTINGRTLKFAL